MRRLALAVAGIVAVCALAGCDPQNSPCDHEGAGKTASVEGHVHTYRCVRTTEHGELEWRRV